MIKALIFFFVPFIIFFIGISSWRTWNKKAIFFSMENTLYAITAAFLTISVLSLIVVLF